MLVTRRRALLLLGGALLAPAIVRPGLAMPVKALRLEVPGPRIPIPKAFTAVLAPSDAHIGDIWFEPAPNGSLHEVWLRTATGWTPR